MKLSNYNKTGILGYITGCGSPGQQNFNLSFTPCSSGLVLLGSLGTNFHFPVTSLSYLQLVSSQEIQWGSLVEVNQAILAWSFQTDRLTGRICHHFCNILDWLLAQLCEQSSFTLLGSGAGGHQAGPAAEPGQAEADHLCWRGGGIPACWSR